MPSLPWQRPFPPSVRTQLQGRPHSGRPLNGRTLLFKNAICQVALCRLCGIAIAITRTHSFTQFGLIFMCESSYCFQRVLAIAILSVCPSVRPSVHLSVRLSITRVDQSKTVQARITKSSPSAAQKTLVSRTIKLFHKFKGGHPERGWQMRGGGQDLRFLANKSLYLSNGAS